LFEPLDFMARLAALVPRPRAHLVRYHGLFAPNAKHRHHIVTGIASKPAPDNQHDDAGQTRESKPTAPMNWMQRLGSGFLLRSTSPIPGVVHRVFDIDLQSCPRCGGTVRVAALAHPCARGISASLHVIAVITEPALIARILEHRDGRDDFKAKAPAGGARAPPRVSLH